MNSGQTVFRQLLQCLPRHDFNLCVQQYQGDYRAKSFSTYDQFFVPGLCTNVRSRKSV